MKLLKIILVSLLASMAFPAGAQFKLFAPDSSLLVFETRHIVAETMNEADAPVTFSYGFTNTGLRKVKIRRVVSTCSCIYAFCDKEVVAPGDKAVITVRFNPKGHPGRSDRNIYVYTKDGNEPAATLVLSVDVDNDMGISGRFPISMGDIRLQRSVVRFRKDEPGSEIIKFVNVSGRSLKFDCDRNMLPECLSFYAEPMRPLREGIMKITYDPSVSGAKDEMLIFLQGISTSPGKAVIKVILE